MLASLQPRCISALCSFHVKQHTRCQKNICRIIVIVTGQEWNLFEHLSEFTRVQTSPAFYRPNVYHNEKISMTKSSVLPLERIFSIKSNNPSLPDISQCSNFGSILIPSSINVSAFSPLNFSGIMEVPPKNAFQNTDNNNAAVNTKRNSETDDGLIVQISNCTMNLGKQQNAQDTYAENVVEMFKPNTQLFTNSSRKGKKMSRKRKIMFLISGACLSCKKSKKDDSFDKAILNQEEPSNTEVPSTSLVIDDVNASTIKPLPENITTEVIEKNAQSEIPLFMTDQAQVKAVTDFNSDLDQVLLNVTPENKSKDSCDQQTDVVQEFLFDELPYPSSTTPEVTSGGRKRRKRKRARAKDTKEYQKKKKKVPSAEGDDETAAKKRPNHFVGIQVSNPQIHSAVKEVQNHLLEQQPNLKSALINPSTLHVTILVFHISDHLELERASLALEESYNLLKEAMLVNPLYMTFEGIGNFQNQVLFAELKRDEALKRINDLACQVKNCYQQHQFDMSNEKPFIPHLTLAKLSKGEKLWKKGIKKIEPSLYEEHKNIKFGIQLVKGLQLLSMMKHKDSKGYYHCEKEFLFDNINEEATGSNTNRNHSSEINSDLQKEKQAIRQKIAALSLKQLTQCHKTNFEEKRDNDKGDCKSSEKKE